MIRFQSNKSMTSEEAALPLFFSASSSTAPRGRVAETRLTGLCECSVTVRQPSHSSTNRQTYKPDEGIALTNEQRVASIHYDERVGLTGVT